MTLIFDCSLKKTSVWDEILKYSVPDRNSHAHTLTRSLVHTSSTRRHVHTFIHLLKVEVKATVREQSGTGGVIDEQTN